MNRYLKVFFKFTLGLTLAALFAAGGAGLENHRAAKLAEAHSGDPLAIIGIQICKSFVGAMVITNDGNVHDVPGTTFEEAHAVAQTLPSSHNSLIKVRCGQQDQTT